MIHKNKLRLFSSLSIVSCIALVLSVTTIIAVMNNLKLAEVNALQLAEKSRIEKDYAVKMNKEAAPRFLERAEFAYQTFNFKDAANFSSSAVELDPSLKKGWELKGEIHFNSEEFNAALEAFSKSDVSPELIAICKKYSEIKSNDSKKLHNDDFFKLFWECILAKLKPQVAGLMHHKAFSDIDLDERISFCKGILTIHNKLEALHFNYDRKTRHLDVSNNPQLGTALVLQNFPCKSIDISHTSINNFICFRSQPLEALNVSHTQIIELHTLQIEDIRQLNISHTSVPNLTKLHGSKVEILNISHTNVQDLSFVQEMPQLKKLTVHKGQFNDQDLQRIKKVEILLVP